MKKNDIIRALKYEAQDIEIPEISPELKSVPITVIPIEIRPSKPKRFLYAPILRLLIVFVLSVGFFHSIVTKAETKVTIDINPSIEFTVNCYDKVVGVKAYNDAGEEFLSKLNINYCSTDEAIQRILTLAEDLDYLSEEDSNAILYSISSMSTCKYEYESKLKKSIMNAFDFIGVNGVTRTVEPSAIDEQAAIQRGVSPAKFAFVRELYARRMNRECNVSEIPKELLDSSVSELVFEMGN